MDKITKVEDLIVWQKAHQLAISIYKITKDFPKDERFGLISQMRRSAVSVPSNIAEAFCRRGKDKFNFYTYSDASLQELKYQLLLSLELEYVNEDNYYKTRRLADEVGGKLNRWVESLKNKEK